MWGHSPLPPPGKNFDYGTNFSILAVSRNFSK